MAGRWNVEGASSAAGSIVLRPNSPQSSISTGKSTVSEQRTAPRWARSIMSDNVHEHPELKAEQAHVDHAHACLDAARERALHLTRMVEVGQGGTNQARFEREAIIDSVAARLDHLDLGDASLVFGRIDQEAEAGGLSLIHICRCRRAI